MPVARPVIVVACPTVPLVGDHVAVTAGVVEVVGGGVGAVAATVYGCSFAVAS